MPVDIKHLLQPVKGCKDFDNNDVYIREYIIYIIKKHFEKYGAVPLDTPIFEYKKLVEHLYGEEFNKLVYELDDHGGEKLILRYDLTVPSARYVASNALKKFKRYFIGKVYRRDNPQKGRLREFWQADFDIYGEDYKQNLQDSEIISLIEEIMTELLKDNYVIKINHREILFALLKKVGIPSDKFKIVCSSLDKLDKLSIAEIKNELVILKDISEDIVDNLLNIIESITKYQKTNNLINTLTYIEKYIGENKNIFESIYTINSIMSNLNKLNKIKFDINLVRGLDYYTGLIFEVVHTNPSVSNLSLAGGGRYDTLIGTMSNIGDIPAIGVSFGIERLVTVINPSLIINKNVCADVYVASVKDNMAQHRMLLCLELRRAGLKTETSYNKNPKMRKQLDYTLEKNIPFMCVIGPDEITNNSVNIKHIKDNKQITIKRQYVSSYILDELDKLI